MGSGPVTLNAGDAIGSIVLYHAMRPDRTWSHGWSLRSSAEWLAARWRGHVVAIRHPEMVVVERYSVPRLESDG